jgi:hypothetical protein
LQGVKRTSNLQAPTMQLTGHAGEVTSLSFSPDGTVLASGSYDRTILFWRTFGECENYMMVRGHKNVVLELHWFSSGDALVSCSADKSVRCWDAHSGEQVKRLREHTAVVNSCSPLRRGPQLIVSGADDGVVKVRPASRLQGYMAAGHAYMPPLAPAHACSRRPTAGAAQQPEAVAELWIISISLKQPMRATLAVHPPRLAVGGPDHAGHHLLDATTPTLCCAVLCCAQVWDFRSKRSVQTLSSKYPVLAVAFSEAGDQVRGRRR